ncbi:M20/M25/M40 family metallo-hydrolase [Deinococcus pimensis]|uniref:M20/M25/M40 family metallo-hydrolase n=1 Tax=Deinococcus pimensis TaxID=309888 RepID=UPI000488228A|nr:M20/M25/M40 family metallo-hydrolase [Deinococcus pimensis]
MPETNVNVDFLVALLAEAAPSGFEARAARVWSEEARRFADVVREDAHGNVYAELNPDAGRPVVLMGHLDEIGMMVSHVDDGGLLSVLPLGGWDSQVLVGQRVRLLAVDGDVIAVIGKKPIHLMDPSERDKVSKMDDLWLDTGLAVDEVRRRVPVGTVGVLEQPTFVQGERVVSRALDNRVGAFTVLEALRSLKERGVTRRVVAVASAQEEIGAYGARTAAYHLDPIAALVVDVTFETTQPGVEVKKVGRADFGSGVNLSVSALTNPRILRELIDVATREGIGYTLSAQPRSTGTDADELSLVRGGVPSGVVSIPLRYMHSPNEMVDLGDVKACVDLMAAWTAALAPEPEFTRVQ